MYVSIRGLARCARWGRRLIEGGDSGPCTYLWAVVQKVGCVFSQLFLALTLYIAVELVYLQTKLLKLLFVPNGFGPATDADARPGPIDPMDQAGPRRGRDTPTADITVT